MVITLYLLVDVADPSLPGALTFNPDESVEVVQLQRDPSPAPPTLAVAPEPLVLPALMRVSTEAVRRQGRRGVGVQPAPSYAAQRLAPDPSTAEEA